jgi:hypothetical protein
MANHARDDKVDAWQESGPGSSTRAPIHAETETLESVEMTNLKGKDEAAQLLSAPGTPIVTAQENARILRMVDWHILPIILTIYCLQSLDKTALSYAAVFGIIDDLHLKDGEYGWASAIVYVAQLVWQPVVAFFLVKLPIGKFCGIMVGVSSSTFHTRVPL